MEQKKKRTKKREKKKVSLGGSVDGKRGRKQESGEVREHLSNSCLADGLRRRWIMQRVGVSCFCNRTFDCFRFHRSC